MNLALQRTHIPLVRKIEARSKKEKKRLLKPIRRMSAKRAKEVALYKKAREEYLKEHPYCEWWLAENNVHETDECHRGWRELNALRSVEIHHKRGRVGKLLYDKTYFMAVSEQGHRWIHNNPKEAYQRGYMLKR